MPKRYPEEFRRKVLDLVAAGRPIAQIAADLGITARKHALICKNAKCPRQDSNLRHRL